MQTLGQRYSGSRAEGAPSPSMLEKASWLDKLPLVLVCGTLLGFSSAGYGVWWLSWIGLAPLILLVFSSRSRSEAMLTGLIFGLAYHLVALRWLLDLNPLDWLGIPGIAGVVVAGQAWALEALHQAVLFACFAIFIYALPTRAGFLPHFSRPYFPMLISVPLIWVFLQWVVAPSPFFLGVPIDQLAYSQSRVPAIIQLARLGGAPLIDFLIVMTNCAVVSLILELTNLGPKAASRADIMSDRTGALFDVAAVAAALYACFYWGHWQMRADAAMPEYFQAPPRGLSPAATAALKARYAPAIPVAVVQPNISIEELDKVGGKQFAQRCLPLVQNIGAALIVMPADTLDQPRRGFEPLRMALAQIARDQKKDVIVGVRDKSNVGIWDGVRIFSADKFNKDTDYMKYRLLPLAEYTPISFLSGLLPTAFRQQVSGGEDHIKPETLSTLKSVFGRVGASVGAEIVYPDLIVSQVTRGASLLVNVVDLSCFHNSILPQELLAAAVMRAVENGRYLVVASNTGVSAVIDPHGVVTSASTQARDGVLVDRVQFLTGKTPYTRMCLWTPLYH